MTTQWGAPLTGAQMKLLRAAGLPDDVMVKPPYGAAKEASRFRYLTNGYRLPADHPAYTLLEKGWLDIPNVRLWFGGDEAPDDWLEYSEVLLRSGDVGAGLVWKHYDFGNDIIAYIAKAEAMDPDLAELVCKEVSEELRLQGFETVTIAKMTREEWDKLRHANLSLEAWAIRNGLIKPEPTLEERFWQGKERNSLSQDEAVKALVRGAIKFGQENPE